MTIGGYLSYGEPITGWMLLRALSDDEENKVRSGQWVLAYARFVLQRQAVQNPSFILDEMPFDMEEDLDTDEGVSSLMSRARKFEASMTTDPQTGFGFYHCCISDGFNPFKDEFYTWVAERLTAKALTGSDALADSDLNRLLDLLVAREEYEKAAEVRDALKRKQGKGSGVF